MSPSAVSPERIKYRSINLLPEYIGRQDAMAMRLILEHFGYTEFLTFNSVDTMNNILPPMDGVYVFVRLSVIEYIGTAVDVRQRMRKHRHSGKYNGQRIIIINTCGETKRVRLETALIAVFDPPLNKITSMYGHRH